MKEVSQEGFRVENEPDSDSHDFPWTMVRSRYARPPKLVILSSNWLGLRTHYLFNRTTPCRKQDCPGCEKKMESRWHGYLLAVEDRTERRFVFEFTAQVRLQLKKFIDDRGSLRGLQVICGRLSDRPNAKVKLESRGFVQAISKLPPEEPIWPICAHIFGLMPEASVTVSENPPPSFEEYCALKDAAEREGNAQESDWMKHRLSDLAGQLVLPLQSVNNGREDNNTSGKT